MAADRTATRRIAIAIVLVVALPFAVGFLSGFSYFVTGERVTPSWVHSTRIFLSWLTVIAVFTWFVAGNDGALVKRVAVVLIASWILSECLAAGSRVVISYVTDLDFGPIWTFRLTDASVEVLRALVGVAAGLAIRNTIMKSAAGVGH